VGISSTSYPIHGPMWRAVASAEADGVREGGSGIEESHGAMSIEVAGVMIHRDGLQSSSGMHPLTLVPRQVPFAPTASRPRCGRPRAGRRRLAEPLANAAPERWGSRSKSAMPPRSRLPTLRLSFSCKALPSR
jgi:hypothetical protein